MTPRHQSPGTARFAWLHRLWHLGTGRFGLIVVAAIAVVAAWLARRPLSDEAITRA